MSETTEYKLYVHRHKDFCVSDCYKKMFMLDQEIQSLEADKFALKKDIEELIELGTDQVVTERILKLQAENRELRACIDNNRFPLPEILKPKEK